MGIKTLSISSFRNLHHIDIKLDANLNLIVGNNAAGKTSLLESIFYLSYGRSFRSTQTKHLIEYDQNLFRLIVTLDEKETRLGIERTLNNQKIRINHQTVNKISELSSLLPVLALHPDSHQLISAGPENRRQFLDWGVFHVEHHFLDSWKKYKKALKQRNAALRFNHPDKLCALWNTELIEYAEIIKQSRENYLKKITPIIDELSDILFPGLVINISYKQGWPIDLEYKEYLEQQLQRDKEKGYTQSGPHRADLKITLDGQSAQHSISRGQQKKLVTLLKIAQLSLFTRVVNKRCVLLYDDLPAELDIENQNKIMLILSKLNIQLFISAIQADQIECKYWDSHTVFHVEHGEIKSLSTG